MTSKSVKPHAQSKILGDFPSPTVQGFTGLRAQPSFGAPGYTVPVRLGSIPQPYQCAWARFLDLGSVSRFRRPCQCVWARFKTIPPHPVTTHHRPPPAPLPPPPKHPAPSRCPTNLSSLLLFGRRVTALRPLLVYGGDARIMVGVGSVDRASASGLDSWT